MRVKLLRRERPDTPDEVTLHGTYTTITAEISDAGCVREARRLLIELVTHEIDEALFVAGLGPDPHDPAQTVVL